MTEPDVARLRELSTRVRETCKRGINPHWNDVLWLIDDRQQALDRIEALEEAARAVLLGRHLPDGEPQIDSGGVRLSERVWTEDLSALAEVLGDECRCKKPDHSGWHEEPCPLSKQRDAAVKEVLGDD